jgi:radical SAM superfamily enzyme YgiQ (UPF0313 family)
MDSAYPFELGPIRPVDEANSLLIRTTRSCPWNKCDFCVNYKGMPFSIRTMEEIRTDIEAAAKYYTGRPFDTCFLQDGDSFIMKTTDLLEILTLLKKYFPTLTRISSYGRAQTMIKKSPEEMKEICDAGLNTLYCGMESGSDNVLHNINKGTTSEELIRSACMAKQAGMVISEFIILGLGGQKLWKEHALETARVLNEINPDFIRVLTIGVKKGSGLEKQLAEGDYTLQTEKNIIEEQRLLIENLNGITSYYKNHHGVDLLMEARGQLPEDKEKLLAIMDRYLNLSNEESNIYTMGKRLGFYNCLDDMNDKHLRLQVEGKLAEIQSIYPGQLDEVFHYLREQVV